MAYFFPSLPFLPFLLAGPFLALYHSLKTDNRGVDPKGEAMAIRKEEQKGSVGGAAAIAASPREKGQTLGVLKLSTDGIWTVKEMEDFLFGLRSLYSLITLLSDGWESDWQNITQIGSQTEVEKKKPIVERSLRVGFPEKDLLKYSLSLLPPEALTIEEISMKSPGWLKILGKFNPFRAIKDLLIIIRDWREERRRRVIENALKEIDVVNKTIKTMRAVNYSEAEIKETMGIFIWNPINRLAPYLDGKKITNAEVETPT
jgi:hypothetical protein